MMISKNDYANDRGFGGGLDMSMGGLITWRCACDDIDSGGDTGTVDVHIDVAVA